MHAPTVGERVVAPVFAVRCLRTQQIVAYESGITSTADPLAGSYFVENLTRELEERALALIEKIDELGGAEKAIAAGFFQEQIARSAYEHQLRVEAGETVIVGVISATYMLTPLLLTAVVAGNSSAVVAWLSRKPAGAGFLCLDEHSDRKRHYYCQGLFSDLHGVEYYGARDARPNQGVRRYGTDELSLPDATHLPSGAGGATECNNAGHQFDPV